MPIYNVTADDISPIFVYSDGWKDTDTTDPDYVSYLNQTYHATQNIGANVTVRFNGSAVWIYGAMRGNHDEYSAMLDGQQTFHNGFSAADEFKTVLFSQTGLDLETEHELIMVDDSQVPNRPWFDVDFITFTAGDGDDSTVMSDVTIDDADPLVQYSQNWTVGANEDTPFYHDQTFHSTNVPGANFILNFAGSAIAVYGATSTNHGPFSVYLDGVGPVMVNGSAPAFRPQALLYYASNLTNTSHVLQIVNTNQNTSSFVDFDYAVISQFFPGPKSSTHHKSDVAAIAGGTVGGVVGLILLVVGLLFFLRYRRSATEGSVPRSDGPVPTFRRPHSSITPFMAVAATSPPPESSAGSSRYPLNRGPNTASTSAFSSDPRGYEVVPQRKQRREPGSPAAGPTGGLVQANQSVGGSSGQPISSASDLPRSSSPPRDAGPAYNPDEHPPPQYGQVFNRSAPSRPTALPPLPPPDQPPKSELHQSLSDSEREMSRRPLPNLPAPPR